VEAERSAPPAAQAATWAWAGKAEPRLGHIRPEIFLATYLDQTVTIVSNPNKTVIL
jgi:hypothetical protein